MLVIANWRDLDHPEAGGAEVVCQEIAARLAASGEQVVLLSAAVEGRPARERRDGYTIVRAGSRFTVYPHALAWLLRHRRSVGAVLDSQNGIPFFTPLAVSRRVPVVMLLHHIHQEQFAKYFPAPVALLGRWLESGASRVVYGRRAVVAVSMSTRDGARRRLGLRGAIWVAPPGSSVTESVRDLVIERTEHPSIVCVGRLVPHKRIEMIVEAFPTVLAEHPDAELTIVGRGIAAAGLRALADRVCPAGRIIFRDDLDDEQRDRLMATSWITVNASQGEGWGLSVIEANAVGVPALAYRRPGLRDSIVDGETGWLIEDDVDLGEAISRALTEVGDLGRAHQLAQHARQWAGQFTWASMTERVRAVIAAESARLARGEADRRRSGDVSTVVRIPAAHVVRLPGDWRDRLRSTDSWSVQDAQVEVLCRGADTQQVRNLLHRLEIDASAELPAGVEVAAARSTDLLRLDALSSSSHA